LSTALCKEFNSRSIRSRGSMSSRLTKIAASMTAALARLNPGHAACVAIRTTRQRKRGRCGSSLTSVTASSAWASAPEWASSPRHVAGFVVLVAVNLLYLLAVDRLGFVVTGTIYLAALMAVLRVKPARVVPLALLLTLAIHFCFYKLLRVPLPWGVLQPVAW